MVEAMRRADQVETAALVAAEVLVPFKNLAAPVTLQALLRLKETMVEVLYLRQPTELVETVAVVARQPLEEMEVAPFLETVEQAHPLAFLDRLRLMLAVVVAACLAPAQKELEAPVVVVTAEMLRMTAFLAQPIPEVEAAALDN